MKCAVDYIGYIGKPQPMPIMVAMQPVGSSHENSTDSVWGPAQEPESDESGRGINVVLRFGVGLIAGLAVAALSNLLIVSPLTARLEPWVVLHLTVGILLGPAGLLGSAIAYFVVTALEVSNPLVASTQTGAYLLVGAVAYLVFHLVPRLDRGLSNLRSYLAFLATAITGSLVIAVIGSAGLFLRTMGIDAFWNGVIYWFASAVTSLLIIAPFVLIAASWRFQRWLVPVDGERLIADAAHERQGRSTRGAERRTGRDVAIGAALVVGTTLVVSPLILLKPQNGGWFALLYLVPILWGSISRGLRGGILVASSSGVAYLIASAVNMALFPTTLSHDDILGQFIGFVILSLVGAITGAFQQARLEAEASLVQSKVELEKRHESLAMVNRLANRLKRPLDVETIAQEAVEALILHSRPPMVAVYLLDDEGLTLDLTAQHGFDELTLSIGQTVTVEGSLSGLAIANRETFVSEDLAKDERVSPEIGARLRRAGYKSVVSIPMVFEMQALGVINLVYRDRGSVAQEDLESFSTIGRTVALALVNARHVARLEYLAFHDMLTGLSNREGLHRWFVECAPARLDDRRKMGLVLIDIDRFKEVNDALGHHVGDQLLTQIGPRIDSALAESTPSVFRLAGDEFAVLFPDLHDHIESKALTRNLLTALTAPFEVAGMALEIEASAGISIYPDDALDGSELLRCADVAVNHAKQTSKRFVRYSPEFDQYTPQRLELASDLGRAIRENELVLHFQPLVKLVDGRPIGFEALVRWNHPEMGLLAPDSFIPLAEVGELIHPLTYWVVKHALEQLRKWQQTKPDLTMAINLSTRNLLDRSCARRLAEIMDQSGVDPHSVEFELTETALLIDLETSSATLSKISESGARVVIDDFRTGYSSMSFLKRYRIHALKIDRSFVGDMRSDPQSRAIVRATVQLARDLDLGVVAEGIEDSNTVDALADIGCEVGQGFYYMRPAAAGVVEQQMKNWSPGRA